jgi:hypothetical protein
MEGAPRNRLGRFGLTLEPAKKMSPASDVSATWVPIRQVAAEFGICVRTVHRWVHTREIGFPRPVFLNKRNYFQRAALDAWKTATAIKVAGATPRKSHGQ